MDGPSGAAPTNTDLPGVTFTRQLVEVAHTLDFQGEDYEVGSMASELLGRIQGSAFNLCELEPTLKSFVQAMPRDAWQTLQHHAKGTTGEGICLVHVDAELASDARVVNGLKELHTLKRVFVSAPAEGRCIDFSSLQSTNPQEGGIQLDKVILHGDAPRGLTLKVPARVTVEAAGQSKPGLWPSLVSFVDGDGQPVGQPCRVHGQVCANDATDFMQPGESNTDDAQVRAHAVRKNMTATMDNGDIIMCRRLVAQRLNDLAAGKPPSHKLLETDEGIKANVQAGVDADLERMIAQGSCAMYTPERFGSMAAEQLADMKPADTRLFAVTTGGHMLGLHLSVTESSRSGSPRREHRVSLYDPTYTAKDQVIPLGEDLSLLQAKSLADCSVNKEEVHGYFGDGSYTVGSVFRWPPGPERQPGTAVAVSVHVPEEVRATAGFLYAALDDGHVALVRESMAALRAQKFGMNKDELAAVAGFESTPGLFRAVSTFSPADVVAEYVQQLLQFEDRFLSPLAKFNLLRAEHGGKTALHIGVEVGRTDTVSPFVRAAHALPRRERFQLLLAPSSSGQPMLSRLCEDQPATPLTEERAHQCAAIYVYLKEVVSSTVLSDAEKEALVSAYGGPPGGERPAATLALNSGNPGAAAAMLLAIAEAGGEPRLQTKLMASLGVTADEILASFARTQFDRGAQTWMFDTILRIEALALL